jgi:hypothetical protein
MVGSVKTFEQESRMTDTVCPIWHSPARIVPGYEGADGLGVYSERAGGHYFISRTAQTMLLRGVVVRQRIALTHEICDHNALGSTFEISSATLNGLPSKPNFPAQDRADRLLRYLISRSGYLGKIIEFPWDAIKNDNPNIYIFATLPGKAHFPLLAWSDSLEIEEVDFLLEMLVADGAIKRSGGGSETSLIVLPKGYTRFAQNNSQATNDQAFVAMWFDPSVNSAYENGIEVAVRDCGYSPMRIDRKEHLNKIDDEIVAEIKRSKFVVADFTSEPDKPRGGVYFEAGYAMGMGIPVVWTCREDLIGQVHFDTRQFNHIVWKDPAELAEKLKNRILATIGQGPIQKYG